MLRLFRLCSLQNAGIITPSSTTVAASAQSLMMVPSMDFSKWSKPVKQFRQRERRTGVAISDEKAAKLSQSESEVEAKRARQIQLQKKDVHSDKHIRTHSAELDQSITDLKLAQLHQEFVFKFEGRKIPIPPPARTPEEIEQARVLYADVNAVPPKETPSLKRKVKLEYFNCEDIVNKKFEGEIKPIQATKESRRSGVLGYKLGMTSIWDKWGKLHPLTVIQVDRCQVVQVKTNETDGFTALQLGVGEKSLKRVNKPSIGHFMKSDVPPKKDLREFRVSKDCILPAGYMMSVRHYTPGQFVDIRGTSIGKGFQGTVKRWNFKMQDATHGNSLSHRVPGSTGQRQDPGRVFKNKKMCGHMGFRKTTSQSLQVFKIDVERSLIFIKGHVPGNPGSLVALKDAVKKGSQNEQFLNFPTFIAGEDKLANVLIMEPQKNDPLEEYIHDNDVEE